MAKTVDVPEATYASQAPIILRAEGLKKRFGGQIVLNGVNLELHQGEVVLLGGENGSGKTTLLNILTGNLEPDAGTINYLADGTPRSYRFPRRWWQELNPFDHFTPEFVAGEGVGRTWQDIRLFGSQTLRDNIAVAEPEHPGENPLVALCAPGFSVRRETALNQVADAMLARFGLAGREESSADRISLGQSKRVAIARAVAAGARILFLDEPLAGLDRQGISDVLDLLKSLVTEYRVTLVIVEHIFNQMHLHGLITTHWLLERGAIQRANGNGGRNGEPKSSTPVTTASSIRSPEWLSLFLGDDCQLVDEHLPRGALLTRVRHAGAQDNSCKPLLEIRQIVVKRGPHIVIGLDENDSPTGLNLTIHEGEIAVLQAPNGWGKSTLFSAIAGLIRVESGSIFLDGRRIDDLSPWLRVQAGLRALLSDRHTFPNLLAREMMRLAGNGLGASDLGAIANRPCSSLSGGERQRVALTAMTPGLVGLYDEPFAALDERNVSRFRSLGSCDAAAARLILVPGQV